MFNLNDPTGAVRCSISIGIARLNQRILRFISNNVVVSECNRAPSTCFGRGFASGNVRPQSVLLFIPYICANFFVGARETITLCGSLFASEPADARVMLAYSQLQAVPALSLSCWLQVGSVFWLTLHERSESDRIQLHLLEKLRAWQIRATRMLLTATIFELNAEECNSLRLRPLNPSFNVSKNFLGY